MLEKNPQLTTAEGAQIDLTASNLRSGNSAKPCGLKAVFSFSAA
jgi:hypothetical protein